MKYRDGYKYQLARNEIFETSFRPRWEMSVERISLGADGTMIVNSGYAWDGASGIVDTKTNLRASCGHDALYQLMRMEKLDFNVHEVADNDFCRWLKEDGAWQITTNLARWGLKKMRGKYANPKNRKKIYTI
jgi:hypothetical protein